MAIRPAEARGVFTDGSWLYTRNLVPGVSVYGETLHVQEGVEYRRWDAERSKLAAYLKKGGRVWPFRDSSSVLYLGAASGTTASHLSDICSVGTILAVEVAPRSFRDLVALAETRPNLFPILADANDPDRYRARLGEADVLYQDVAQRDQEGIFLRNLVLVRPHGVGFLIVKARSANVASDPARVYLHAEDALRGAGRTVRDVRVLDPYAKDHAAVVVET